MKKALKYVCNEFIFGGHLVALGPTVISFSVMRLKSLEISWPLLFSVYLVTYIIHLLDRYFDIATDSSPERKQHFERYYNKIFYPLTISLILLVASIIHGGYTALLIALFLVVVGILYSLLFKNLTRYIIGFKSFYTAIAFSSVALFSAFFYDLPIDNSIWLIFAFFTTRWFANTIFCDIKDNSEDSKLGLKTFSLVFGKPSLGALIIFVGLISIGILLYGTSQNILPAGFSVLGISVLYNFYYLQKARRPGADFQNIANVWADGESIIWLLAILIGASTWG